MQFHTLVGGFIGANGFFALNDSRKVQYQILVKLGVVHLALNNDPRTFFDATFQFGGFFIRQHLGGTNGAGAITELKHHDGLFPTVELLKFDQENLAFGSDFAGIHIDFAQFDHFPYKWLAVDNLGILFGTVHGGVGILFRSELTALRPLGRRSRRRRCCRSGNLVFLTDLCHTGSTDLLIILTGRLQCSDFHAHRVPQQIGGILLHFSLELFQTGGVPALGYLQNQMIFRQRKAGFP